MKNAPVAKPSVRTAVPPVAPPSATVGKAAAESVKTPVDPRAAAEWALLRRVVRKPELATTDAETARAFVMLKTAFTDLRRRRLALELLLAEFDAEKALAVFCRSLPVADAAAARKFLLS